MSENINNIYTCDVQSKQETQNVIKVDTSTQKLPLIQQMTMSLEKSSKMEIESECSENKNLDEGKQFLKSFSKDWKKLKTVISQLDKKTEKHILSKRFDNFDNFEGFVQNLKNIISISYSNNDEILRKQFSKNFLQKLLNVSESVIWLWVEDLKLECKEITLQQRLLGFANELSKQGKFEKNEFFTLREMFFNDVFVLNESEAQPMSQSEIQYVINFLRIKDLYRGYFI